MLRQFWDRVFRKREDCYWFIDGWCYKEYPTGYEEVVKDWIKCNILCKSFKWEEKD